MFIKVKYPIGQSVPCEFEILSRSLWLLSYYLILNRVRQNKLDRFVIPYRRNEAL